jgi:N-acyl-D-amino-acid deacylase
MLLKNGLIYDGSGERPFTGSLLIEKDRIKTVFRDQDLLPDITDDVIDCTGLIITPGFIDSHSHNDFFAGKQKNLPYFLPFIKQGITTMVCGNCGFSAAGYSENSPYNDLVGGGLFDNDHQDYSDFATWAQKIDKKLPVNMISLVGHGTIRIGINGNGNELLTADQLVEMERVIEKTLNQGAAGVSFGLMYEPGQFAPFSELEKVARIVKKHDKIVTFHARACSKVSTSYQPPVGGRAHNLRAMDEVLQIAFNTRVRTEYSHLIFVGKKSWNTVEESLRLLEDAKKTGHDIGFDLYPMEFGASIITVVLPPWYLGMKPKKQKRLFTKIRLAIEVFVAKKALGFGFHDILIANTFGQIPEIEGKRISEIAKERKQRQLKTYLDIIEKTNAKVNVLMFNYQNKDIIERLRHHPQAVYMTDAWIEPEASVQNDASYIAFAKFLKLAQTQDGLLEAAIHKMTLKAAERFRIPDRGLCQAGKFADINVIDPNQLAYMEGKNVSPSGWKYILINGRLVFIDGEVNDETIENSGRFIPIP